MPDEHRIILKYADEPGYTRDIDCYLKHGGYEILKQAFKMKPDEIHQEVMDSGLRGRGGAGLGRTATGFADGSAVTIRSTGRRVFTAGVSSAITCNRSAH